MTYKSEGVTRMENEVNFNPIKIMEVELSHPLPEIIASDGDGKLAYQSALVLVRLHSYPLGLLDIDFMDGVITPVQLAVECWAILSDEINDHLHRDGSHTITHLPVYGLSNETLPGCKQMRRDLLLNAPMISVVVATRDRGQSLAKMMKSLLAQKYPHYEIILVDNAPKTSETYDFFNQNRNFFLQKGINLRYIREDVPGLAVAHNRGLEAVNGEFVAFTDDDVIVDRLWLAEILHGFNSSQAIGCVTGLVIPAELETPAQVLFEEFGGFTKGFSPQIFDLRKQHPKNEFFPYSPGRYGTGANMAFRTRILKKMGGFDPALGVGTPSLGADDLAIFFKVIMDGYQLMYQPTALVHHKHRRTYEGLRNQMYGYGTGLTAFLMKCILDQPYLIFGLLPKIPPGLQVIYSPSSQKNMHKSRGYPKELERIERRGMLFGPFAYLYSRWAYRKMIRTQRMEIQEDSNLSLGYTMPAQVNSLKEGKQP